jgi:hypothetical protein
MEPVGIVLREWTQFDVVNFEWEIDHVLFKG